MGIGIAVSPRVLFVVTGLHTGGAERQLALLLSRLHGRSIEAGVVSLAAAGTVSAQIEALGIPVWRLNLDTLLRLPQAFWRIVKITRAFRPDVVQGWMYHGNLAACVATTFAVGRPALVWGIRQSLYDLAREKMVTRLVIRLGARVSRWVDALVYNSEISRIQHEAHRFDRKRARVIDNGFDTDAFRPDLTARDSVRRELGIPKEASIVGCIARYHPMKAHRVFLDAAAKLAKTRPDAHFLLAGRGVIAEHPDFAHWLHLPELAGRLHLLGERQDIPRLIAALDIVSSSSSWGEAFPNVIGEAMCCAVPCVVTDVGDCRRIVGDTGRVIPAGDSSALAEALDNILALSVTERWALGEAGRRRVRQYFSLDEVASRYASLYQEVRKIWMKI